MKRNMRTVKRRLRRIGFVLAACLLLVSSAGVYLYQRFIAEQFAAAQSTQTIAGDIRSDNLPWPSYGQAAVGAVGYNTATYGKQKPAPTASVAKVMTALAILKKKPLTLGEQGPVITITQHDKDLYDYYKARDGSLAAVQVGEQITEYEALQALLLPSSNNMADTLAIWAFGSVDAYSDYANELARSLGMTQSDFADASGFSPETVSTAEDLIKLGQKAMQNPVIAQIVGQKSAIIPVAGTIHNTNALLDTPGINGLKTGNTDEAGGVFMGARIANLPSGETVQIISVVMGAPDVETALADSKPLLATAAWNFGDITPSTQEMPTIDRRPRSEMEGSYE